MGRKKASKNADVAVKTQPKVITQYIKRPAGEVRGVMAAVCDETGYSLGYSLVNKSAGDRFNKTRGLNQAVVRAKRNLKRPSLDGLQVPPSILESMQHFEKRAQSYFKDKQKGYTQLVPQPKEKRGWTPEETAMLEEMFRPDALDALVALSEKYDRPLPKTVVEIVQRHRKNLTKK